MADALDDLINRYTPSSDSHPAGDVQSIAQSYLDRPPPSPTPPAQSQPQDKNTFIPASISQPWLAGWNELQGLGDYGIAAGAGLIGANQTRDQYIQAAQQQFQEAQQKGNPVYERSPFDPNWKWSDLPGQIVYQGIKTLPMTLLTGGAGGVVGRALGEAGVNILPKLGAEFAGKTAAKFGVQQGAEQTAEQLGQNIARQAAGVTAANYPLSVGSVYSENVEKGDRSPQASLVASVLGAPHAALEAAEIGQVAHIFSRGMPSAAAKTGVTNWLKDTLFSTGKEAVKAAAGEGVAEGFQTGIEQSVRTDLSFGQRAHNMVEGALMGMIGGAGMGGGAHLAGRGFNALSPTVNVPADKMDNTALKTAVDVSLNPSIANQPPQNIGPNSRMRQGAPGPNETAIEVSAPPSGAPTITPPTERLVEPNRPSPVQPPSAPTQQPGVTTQQPSAPLPTARAATYQAADPYAHFENEELANIFQNAPNEQVKQGARAEIERRLNPPAATPEAQFAQKQAAAQQELAKQLGLNNAETKALKKFDIAHPMEAMDLAKAKIEEATQAGKKLSPVLRKLNDFYGITDATGKVQSDDDLTAQRDQQAAIAATPNLSESNREDAQYRADTIQKQLDARSKVAEYKAQFAAQTPSAASTTETPSAIQKPGPESVYVQPAPEAGGTVEQGNAEGSQASREGLGAEIRQEVPREETRPQRPVEQPLTPGPAIWANRDFDMPVEIVGQPEAQPAPDGRVYQRVRTADGTENYVPLDELRAAVTPAAPAEIPAGAPPVTPPGPPPITPPTEPLVGERPTPPGAPPGAPPITPPSTPPGTPPGPPSGPARRASKFAAKALQAELYTTTGWHQVARFERIVPSLRAAREAQAMRTGAVTQFAEISARANDGFQRLINGNKKERELAEGIQRIARATRDGIDANKPWAAHSHLFSEPDVAVYREEHRQVRQDLNNLRRAGKEQALNDVMQRNKFEWTATATLMLYEGLKNQIQNDPRVPPALKVRLVDADPATNFIGSSTASQNVYTASQNIEESYDKLHKIAEDFIATAPLDEDQTAVKELIDQIDAARELDRKAPYFHLARTGDQAIRFDIVTTPDGMVDKAAAKQVSDAIDAAFPDRFEIAPKGDRTRVFIRVDDVNQRAALEQIARDLRAKGLVQPDSIHAGQIGVDRSFGNAPQIVENLIRRMESEPGYSESDGLSADEIRRITENRAAQVRTLRRFAVDMLGDTDARKLNVRRRNIEGFEKNMVLGAIAASDARVRTLGQMIGSPRVSDALTAMRMQAKAAENIDHPDHAEVDLIKSVYAQQLTNESDRSLYRATTLDHVSRFVSGVNYAASMGLRVSSAGLQLMQVPQVLAPELAKKIGYVKAYKSIANATGPAIQVMRALVQETMDRQGKDMWDAPITTAVIKRSNLSTEQKEFLTLFGNLHGLGSNNLARELGHLFDERRTGLAEKAEQVQKFATSMVYYAETFSRALAALSAYEAYSGEKKSPEGIRNAVKYAGEINRYAMFDFDQANKSQLMSRTGPAGALTPIWSAFMSYTQMLNETLFRETARALSLDTRATPEQRAEARTFMAGHLVTTAIIAGSLGLPMVNFLAAGWDKLLDEFDPDHEPHDIRALFIKHVLGLAGQVVDDSTAKTLTRIIVEGLPAAAGVSLQSRAGEQDIFPGTRTLFDSTKPWGDRVKDFLGKTTGSPGQTLVNFVKGLEQVMSGDVTTGLSTFSGPGVRDLTLAWKMAETGKFYDAEGNILPGMKVEPLDVVTRAAGFTPTKEAEYRMQKDITRRYEAPLEQESARLSNNLARARQNEDKAAFREYAKQAREYMQRHPEADIFDRAEKLYKRRKTELKSAEKGGTVLKAPKDRDLATQTEGIRGLRQ